MPFGSTGGNTGGSVGGGQKIELPIAADGQTVFTLPDFPADEFTKFWVEVNGVSYYNPASVTLSGLVLTWLEAKAFKLKTTDTLVACFF